MPAPSTLFHALLRPSTLQILRATGYHGTSPAVLDAVTDLAARYLTMLCEKTASHALHNHDGEAGDYTVAEVRMALEEAGALLPARLEVEQQWRGEEDTRGVDEFVAWFSGPRMKEIAEFAHGDGENDGMDYLNALKKRHNKTSDDSKFQGTILGRPAEAGGIEIEGGDEDVKSIWDWVRKRTGGGDGESSRDHQDVANGHASNGVAVKRSASMSSGLSSVGDRLNGDGLQDMDLS
ncbi:hypothetical protein GMORB2_7434 [Geosmithia morbida]|uniref:Bromodomain associated domain-containing protein n=1 Tax=Geosmithia morbida TaxID=1094350 RepID=A0A9P4YTU4_9HYPO|nr:uncharacterized protein GMORB2_7434 [Geosmithia morbida]KAF4122442.1 hypothetical protein GMORB2_7434 [Geosmithia morbida]